MARLAVTDLRGGVLKFPARRPITKSAALSAAFGIDTMFGLTPVTDSWNAARAEPVGYEQEVQPRQRPADAALPGLDEVELSPEARKFAESAGEPKQSGVLTGDQQREVEALIQSDQKVRAHEQAHLAAAGGLARGGAKFQYKTGPDGKQYAIGGEVQIDTTSISGDPAATLRKAEQIRRAATAPADPSAQDQQVAAEALKMAAEARQQLAEKTQTSTQTKTAPQGYTPKGLATTASRPAATLNLQA